MARRMSYSIGRITRNTAVTLLVSALLVPQADVASADDSPSDSSSSAVENRIASLFAVNFVQPSDEADPEEPALDPLAELESLLQAPVLVPGDSAATQTAIADEQLVSIGGFER